MTKQLLNPERARRSPDRAVQKKKGRRRDHGGVTERDAKMKKCRDEGIGEEKMPDLVEMGEDPLRADKQTQMAFCECAEAILRLLITSALNV